MSEQRLELNGLTCRVYDDGSVDIYCEDDFRASFSSDSFKLLAEAQRNAVWAAQHWTSIAQVSDALASLLAVYPGVWVQRVDTETAEGKQYYYASLIVNGVWETVFTTTDVQELFRQLNKQSASVK